MPQPDVAARAGGCIRRADPGARVLAASLVRVHAHATCFCTCIPIAMRPAAVGLAGLRSSGGCCAGSVVRHSNSPRL